MSALPGHPSGGRGGARTSSDSPLVTYTELSKQLPSRITKAGVTRLRDNGSDEPTGLMVTTYLSFLA
ncbi:hypothetical protein EVAR_66169_1 [Eumeta japonica]|uniref:Uncharacterized protein n=1 Tax=Eumeta variegata TaxID=151549 RepID=A0A4C1ZM19_EUMVA|nr:hypothetical protein EVAR_66169_1 [Eumeta japonica]